MVWTLILVAVHINNPQDQPGKIELTFKDQLSCETALTSMKWQLKFNSFKVEGKCLKQF
jgi:hypothetical protein